MKPSKQFKRNLFLITYIITFLLALAAWLVHKVPLWSNTTIVLVLSWIVVATAGSIIGWFIVKAIYLQTYNSDYMEEMPTKIDTESSKELAIIYELSPADIMAYQMSSGINSRQFIRNRNVLRRLILFTSTFLIFVAVFIILYFQSDQFLFSVSICIIVLSVFTLLWMIISPPLLRRFAWQVIRKTYSEGKNKLIGKHRLLINKEGVKDTTDMGDSMTRWDAITNISSDDKYLFIAARASDTYIIPRNAFTDDSSFQNFIETANAYHDNVKT